MLQNPNRQTCATIARDASSHRPLGVSQSGAATWIAATSCIATF